jgi:enoyl-CoA hydratase/carnithine racemase
VRADQPTAERADPQGWVRTAREGAVLTVTLDRADQLNAQTPATWAALRAVGKSLDDGVRVVVVTGAGRSFSAGLDRSLFSPAPGVAGGLGELGSLPPELAEERIRGYQAAFRWLRSPGIVSIAAVQGHAIGAGAQLALACDLRVVAEDAQVRLPEATLGLVPDLTGTSTLVELVGYSRAVEMCLTGRPVGAAEAVAIGLANVAVPVDQLAGTVRDLTEALLAVDVGASRATLALLRSAVRNDPERQDAAERAAQVRRLGILASSP